MMELLRKKIKFYKNILATQQSSGNLEVMDFLDSAVHDILAQNSLCALNSGLVTDIRTGEKLY